MKAAALRHNAALDGKKTDQQQVTFSGFPLQPTANETTGISVSDISCQLLWFSYANIILPDLVRIIK